MLTFEQAKKIGVDACIEKLGRDFVNQFKDTSCDAYADMKDYAYCFVGVDNRENRYGEGVPALTSTNTFPYIARPEGLSIEERIERILDYEEWARR
mgnify:CR=1 FL=1